MIEQLFGSKTRVKLLKLFFSNPNRSFYVREITRTIDEQINSVRRELSNLLSLGLITSDSTNNKLYYEVNQKYEHFEALQAMFAQTKTKSKPVVQKKEVTQTEAQKQGEETVVATKNTEAVELPEAEKWQHTGNIVGIVYSGAYTRDEHAPVDILIIGDVNVAQVEAVIVQLEKDINRELRYAVIDQDEWRYRGQVRDKFWLQVIAAKKQIVLQKDALFIEK
jgi:predicted transcriptional regulator